MDTAFEDTTEEENTSGIVCPQGEQKYVDPDGTVSCINIICPQGKQQIVYPDGTVTCHKKESRTKIVVDDDDDDNR